MSKATRLLESMKANPRGDWTADDVKILVRANNLKLRQRGTSHAVITNIRGQHLTVPMRKPIKPFYIRRLTALLEEAAT